MESPSVWIATTPETSLSALSGTVEVDVCVVGGGITGLTTATLLRTGGASVAVLEARRLVTGTTGNTTAKLTSLHGLVYAHLQDAFGEDGARRYAEANEAGLALVASLVQDRGIDCGLRRTPAYTYTEDERRVGEIEREVEAAQAAGLQASYVEEVPLPWPTRAAVRVEDQLIFHPRAYCLALAAALAGDGSHVFEQSRAYEVEEEGGRCVVRTATGSVICDRVVVTTLLPFLDRGGFFAKTHPSRGYALAVAIEGAPPEGMFLRAEDPTRSVRPLDLDGPALVVEGQEHKTGQDEDTGRHYEALESWARERFPVRAIPYRWSAQDYISADRVPYVGRMASGSDRILVATGYGKWGLSNGSAAAVMLSDLALGRDNPWLPLFDATRLKPGTSLSSLIRENIDVGKRFVTDRLSALRSPAPEELAPGEGGLVSHGGETLAAFRDEDGRLHALSPVCTHLGCLVQWNAGERTWDCPCHGSRFETSGTVIEGPALRALERRELDPTAPQARAP
jgi:glycine/D-amino acid oxidase-like deaminating enzyme/nitrite reductase/ring-hydroxylating ferredoxin subunit